MEIISNYKKIQDSIYNFDYKKYQKIILFILSLMASSLFFYCVFKLYGLQRKKGISTTKLNQLKEKKESEEFQATAKNVELEDQEEHKLEIQRIPTKFNAETVQNLIAKSEQINPEINELMNSMLQTIEEENQLSINLENEKIKFIEFQIKANLNSEKNDWQDALTKTFLDNYVIELYGKLFALSQGVLIQNAKRDLEFLYKCLIEKEKNEFGTRHGKKIENNTQIFHVKETGKQYCEKTINPIIEQIIKNNIENKTEYNYQAIAFEINKFFNDLKKINLTKEQKIQAIQYIKLNKLQHIFDSQDFSKKKQEFLIIPDNSDEEIQDIKEDDEFIVVKNEEEKKQELLKQIKTKVDPLIDLIINYQEFIENLANYVNLKIDFLGDEFKKNLKTKISNKIPFNDLDFNNLNKFFAFNHIETNTGITRILLESFEEIQNELLTSNMD